MRALWDRFPLCCWHCFAAAVGLVNGFLVAKCRISSFIVTIGTSYIFKGIALKISNGDPYRQLKPPGLAGWEMIRSWGILYLVIIMVLLVLITHYVLTATRFGRNIYTIGRQHGSRWQQRHPYRLYKTSIFVLSAFYSRHRRYSERVEVKHRLRRTR